MLRNWVVFNKLPSEQLIRVKHIHVFEGGRSAMYVTSGDVVYGVGANGTYNLLGLSGRQRSFSLVLEPVSVERLSLKAINTIAVGDFFGVANNTNGELYHWGRRMDRRRGILLPHQVKCPYFVIDVACGSEFFIILTKEQKIFFRGSFQPNDHPILEFTEVSIEVPVGAISCGKFHAAMLTTDGEVYNCGYDHHATYRTWKPEDGLNPKKLDIREQCTQVVCGRRSTLCLLSSGAVWACGENDSLGVESENSVMKHPAKVKIAEPVRELAATWFSNIYAASAWNGRIYCWGNKTRWPTLVTDACVLLDSFKNKETPSNLGMVPVAPQLSPCSSFSAKISSRNVRTPSTVSSASRLERSLSVDSLCTPYKQPMTFTDADKNNNNNERNEGQLVAKSKVPNFPSSSKQLFKQPGFALLASAGKYLIGRPIDRKMGNNVRKRAVSPEAHPSKVQKPQLSIPIENSFPNSKDLARSQSVENILLPSSPTSKSPPNILSIASGRTPAVKRKSPLNSPVKETAPTKFPETGQPSASKILNSNNPFFNSETKSIYPDIPSPVENDLGNHKKDSRVLNTIPESPNPFLYDLAGNIEFKFEHDAAKCYSDNQNHTSETNKPSTNGYNPGTKAMLHYYTALADIKSDFSELQKLVNEMASIIYEL